MSIAPEQLQHYPLFARFAKQWQPFLPSLRTARFEKDQRIATHGDSAQTVWFVLEGWVSLERTTPDGKNVTVGLCTVGDMFGEAGLFKHASYPYHAQSIQAETQLLVIPAHILQQLSAEHAEFSSYLMELMNERLSRTQLKLEHRSSLSATQRLGCFLLQLCHQQKGSKQSVVIPIDKQVVASYLGIKAETLSRSFQQLQALAIDVDHAHITVRDIDKLLEFVCSSCGESGACATEEEVTQSHP